VGPAGPYKGASTDYYNYDPSDHTKVHLSKYMDGKLSTDYSLGFLELDPYHDCSDVLRQLFFEKREGYDRRETPDMGGFVWNNGTKQIMLTYGPEQLPVLDGLAKHFAVSDEWFCSMPSATDVNRAFAVSGSGLGQLNNFMSPPEYYYWPDEPHRASIWKLLWANGITDWKIYNSILWYNQVFTYQLFLEGQIPSVDADSSAFLSDIDTFYQDARAGNLPRFSFLEPVWIGSTGTSSYHPGEDIVPGEQQLNQIYDALRQGPKWNSTMLIVTFDEHGGIYDHVRPPYARRPWPHDVIDGFAYDLLGPRVPTIVVSPWVEQHTVFRSTAPVVYDSTSFAATLLSWAGIPRERWFMGDRMADAPTFESVLTRSSPRPDSPTFTPPYDKQYPPTGASKPSTRIHDLHRTVAAGAVRSLAHEKMTAAQLNETVREVVYGAKDLPDLIARLDGLQRRLG
jgi:hypothetical protein